MVATAIRIARHMGLHSEAVCARHPPFEAEMRRRLWWALVLHDSRIAEISCQQPSELLPTWDCRLPLDVNDTNMQPNMKEVPRPQARCGDALFFVVRCELLKIIRGGLGQLMGGSSNGRTSTSSSLVSLENTVENKYLKSCDSVVPVNYYTIKMARGFLLKMHLIEFHVAISQARTSSQQASFTDAQRDNANHLALTVLEYDTEILTSPLTQGFIWFARFHFPLVSYLHLTHDLRYRPHSTHAERAWEAMSNNYTSRCVFRDQEDGQLFLILTDMILQAWAPREQEVQNPSYEGRIPGRDTDVDTGMEAPGQAQTRPDKSQIRAQGKGLVIPGIVQNLRQIVASQQDAERREQQDAQCEGVTGANADVMPTSSCAPMPPPPPPATTGVTMGDPGMSPGGMYAQDDPIMGIAMPSSLGSADFGSVMSGAGISQPWPPFAWGFPPSVWGLRSFAFSPPAPPDPGAWP
jgi:hypothetical protein